MNEASQCSCWPENRFVVAVLQRHKLTWTCELRDLRVTFCGEKNEQAFFSITIYYDKQITILFGRTEKSSIFSL